MCGIVGAVLNPVSVGRVDGKPDYKILPHLLKNSLSEIQHRGYDGAGLTIATHETLQCTKNYGLIKDVLTEECLSNLLSQCKTPLSGFGLAHTRYKTVGECSPSASQPLLNKNSTLCLVHNGQIETHHVFPDSGYLLQIWDEYFSKGNHDFQAVMVENLITTVVREIFKTVKGSYSCLVLIQGYGLVAFRDPHGIRPLLVGRTRNRDYFFASEDVCFNNNTQFPIERVFDLEPGSCMIVRQGGSYMTPHATILNLMENKLSPCIFEYIYLAKQASCLNKLPVEKARELLGETLASKIQREYPTLHIDFVIPVPETSCHATKALADKLNLTYLNIMKLNPNRRQPRSFILPTQELRTKAVANKFILDQEHDFKGKNLLLVDDSIIRGTTLKHLVKIIRNKYRGINNVYVASIAPPVRNKNIYGIDIPDTELLLAFQRENDEIQDILNVDLVIYQDLQEMLTAFKNYSGIPNFEYSMFVSDNKLNV